MRRVISRFIRIGENQYGGTDTMKYVRVLNLTSLFYAFSAIAFFFIFIYYEAAEASVWISGYAVVFLLTPILNRLGYFELAKYVLMLFIYSGIALFSVLLGKDAWVEFIFLTAPSAAFMLTPKAYDPLNFISLILSVLLFFLLRLTDAFDQFAIEGVNSNIKYSVLGFVFIMPYTVLSSMKIEQENYVEKLKQQMKEKEILSREVHHRVKNNFQIITSLISLQMRRDLSKNEFEFLNSTRNRIYTMALVHERLHNHAPLSELNCKEYLESIIQMLLSYSGKENDIKYSFKGGETSVSPEKAIPMGLIICEIITNSIKHAFNKSGRGEIYVHMKELSENEHAFQIGDNGEYVPRNGEIEEGGIGSILIDELVKQLDGKLSRRFEDGTHYELIINCS